MATNESIWIGKQLKARILRDRYEITFPIRQMKFPGLGESAASHLWDIVVSYVCEDPRVIDVILSQNWNIRDESESSLLSIVHCEHYLHSPYITVGRWDDVRWDDTSYSRKDGEPGQIDWKFYDGDAWDVLLMFPFANSNYIEIPCAEVRDLPKLRKILYARISSP
jgi:hypothetical protein